MVTITRYSTSKVKHEHQIYEPGDVIPPTLRVVPYRNRRSAMRGELVTDINGRMVPLLRRITINKEKGHVNMIFPGFCWQPWKQDIFSYPLEKAQEPAMPKALGVKHYALAGFIAEGMPLEIAMKRLWPRDRYRGHMITVRRAFANQDFIHYLFVELGYVQKLKEALESRNVSVETIADQIEDLITNNAAPSNLRKWAMETALEALDSSEKPKGSLPMPEGPTMAELVAIRMQQALPEHQKQPAQEPSMGSSLHNDPATLPFELAEVTATSVTNRGLAHTGDTEVDGGDPAL